MKYWKVAAGSGAAYWEDCIGDGIIFYGSENFKDCRKFDSDEQILELGKELNEVGYADDLILFYKKMKIGDKIVLYGKKSIIALGEIRGDYEYAKKYAFSHIRKVEWKEIYRLNLYRSDFLSKSLEKKLQYRTTFRKLTEDDWREIETCNINGKHYPITMEKDIQLNIAANLNTLKEGLKLYSKEYTFLNRNLQPGKRIDIFAYDDEDNVYIIEIKRGKAEVEALEQTLDYMKLVNKKFVIPNKMYGYIIAYDFKDDIKKKAREYENISLIKYLCKFEFEEEV